MKSGKETEIPKFDPTKLVAHHKMNEKDRLALQSSETKLRKLVGLAQYEKAFGMAQQVVQKFPQSTTAWYLYAVLLGDCEEYQPEKVVVLRHKKAAALLKKLLYRIRLFPAEARSGVFNEYYWFSHQPLKQFKNGQRVLNQGNRRGYYGMGVGAVEYAKQLLLKGQFKRGQDWAKIAEESWHSYFSFNAKYYNSYCWYARACGYQRKLYPMEDALKKAMKLSGRTSSYKEFQDVRHDVSKVLAYKPKTKGRKQG